MSPFDEFCWLLGFGILGFIIAHRFLSRKP